MRKQFFFFFVLLVFLLVLPSVPLAEETKHGNDDDEHLHRHHAALFFGNTSKSSKHGITLGLDYQYRLNHLFGIGGVIEYIGGDFDAWLGALPLFIHPYKGLRLLLGPGVERKNSQYDFLVRAGVGYEFKLTDKWSLTPEFSIDFLGRDETLVYGLGLGYEF